MHISSPYHPSKILRFVLRLMSSGVMSDTKVFVEAIDLEAAKLVDDAANLQESIGLEWENISYTTSDKDGMKKTLIHPMSGCAIPGEMLALMGTSGAGKSTLLDILAGRLVSKNLTGKILANKRPVNFNSFRKQSGYVMQSDALFPLLTVKETLYYAAHLRIQGKTYAEREAAAATTMRLLRLEHVQDTIVGDEQNRGLSGGEKRRVSIAVDIIHEPRVIFLDEPTSGNYPAPTPLYSICIIISLMPQSATFSSNYLILLFLSYRPGFHHCCYGYRGAERNRRQSEVNPYRHYPSAFCEIICSL